MINFGVLRASRIGTVLCIAGVLTACSGTRGAPGVIPVGPPDGRQAVGSGRAAARLTVRIRVPARRRTRSRYVSAATKGMKVSFAGTSTVSDVFDLTPSSPDCSGAPLTCTFDVALAAGSYKATVDTYDEAPAGGAIPAGAGLLSTAANVPVTVVSGTANHLSLTLDGVPASFTFGGFPDAWVGSGFLNQSFSVTVKDAGGDAIVGTYAVPVTLSDRDATGATAVSPATLSGSSDTAEISYTGAVIGPVTIDATAGAATGSATFNVFEPVFVADLGAKAVKEIPVDCDYAGCVTSLDSIPMSPIAVTFDGTGNLYYADSALNEIVEMSPCIVNYCGNAVVGSGFSNVNGLTVDPAGKNVYVSSPGSVQKLNVRTCNLASCAQQIAQGAFDDPFGVALDAAGNLYVADASFGEVLKVPASCVTSPGTPCTAAALGGTTFVSPQGVAVDQNGNLFVADTFGAVYEMPNTCTANACATQVQASFLQPSSVAVDGFDDVFVLDSGNKTVTEVESGCTSHCTVQLGGGAFTNPTAIAVP